MINVLISMERLDEHVIYVDFHGVVDLVGEHLVTKSLVGCIRVLQSKGHNFIVEDASLSMNTVFSWSSGCIRIWL